MPSLLRLVFLEGVGGGTTQERTGGRHVRHQFALQKNRA